VECRLPGLTFFYEAAGTGRPVVIFHGAGGDHSIESQAIEPLFASRPGWRRLYPDLPGHGGTPPPPSIRSNDGVVDALVRFVDAVLPGERFTLVGHSYGAYLARGVAHRLAERIDGLLLWAPAMRYPRSERQLPQRVVRVEHPRRTASTPCTAEPAFADAKTIESPEALQLAPETTLPGTLRVDASFLRRVSNTPFSFEPESPPRRCPTLIVCGRHDSVVGFLDAWQLLDRFPNARFVLLGGAGHFVGLTEEVETFRALVGDWLDGLPPWTAVA
jgi:pimeloyl-ACP methyl ester carboxylesterase